VQKALRDHEQELRKSHDELELKVAERTSELQRSAQELQRSEFYLAEGQRLGHTGSWAFNPSGFFEHWSRELFQIYGLDPQKGAPTLEQYLATIHPEDRDLMAETVKRMCEQGSGCDVKKRIIRPDGAARYVRCVGIPVLDNGVLKRFLGTAMDVTEQEQLTQELRRREAYLAEAQRLSQTGSWAWSPDTDVRYWSEECYRVLGFDPRDGLPRMEELIQRIHPDDQPAFRESTKRARHITSDEGVNYRIVHPGGAVRDIYSIGHPVFSPSGDLIEYTGTVIDVTERKRAEQELQQLVDFVPQLSVVLESDGEVIHANRVFREYTGLTLEELRSGDAVASLIHPDDLERMRAARKHGFAGNEPFELDARLLGKDGIHRWFLARYNPLVEEGRARRWYVSVTEIESRKQEEERVRKENVRLEERTRIAQELHDTLLQTFQSASLYLGAALYRVAQDSPLKPQLDRILQIMSQGIAEGRSAIQGLRSSVLSNLRPGGCFVSHSGRTRGTARNRLSRHSDRPPEAVTARDPG